MRRILVTSTVIFLAMASLGLKQSPRKGEQCGVASYYTRGDITANGEAFNPGAYTAAHRWIPFDTWVTVVDQDTGLAVDVRINDRGPWVDRHILDLTPTAIDTIDPNRTSDLRHVCLYW